MKNKKKQIALKLIPAAVFAVYLIPLFYYGEGSFFDLFFGYFMVIMLIISLIPYNTSDMTVAEKKVYFSLFAVSAIAVIIPAIVFICLGSEVYAKMLARISFWWYYPYIIFFADAFITLIFMSVFKKKKKVEEK